MPAVVRRPGFSAEPRIRDAWREKVNGRRNAVVHRAVIDLTQAQAEESMRAALEAIVLVDPSALVRPHAYYLVP